MALHLIKIAGLFSLMITLHLASSAQTDSAHTQKGMIGLDSFFRKQKGLVGRLARNLVTDTSNQVDPNTPVRNDLIYSKYEGRIIRSIEIQRVDFGTPLADTMRSFRNNLTRLADFFHHKSREYVIRNNLFFKPGDKVFPYLLADNERHLRDQPYLQDAKIIIKPIRGRRDSVDILVQTKDVLSIGGTLDIRNANSAAMSIKEDNLDGQGNRLSITGLYDTHRSTHTGGGAEFIQRNISGSFIDGYIGYKSFNDAFNGGDKEENMLYARMVRPLVNPYLKWTYLVEATYHNTRPFYQPDSIYTSDYRYTYYTYDAWVGLNTGAYKLTSHNEDGRLRSLVGLRFMKQLFLNVPGKFANKYNYSYADVSGVLGSYSVFKQNFYKANYIYGFGRNEDVPEGLNVTLSSGVINKQQVIRPYFGIDLQKYFFTEHEAYYNFTGRLGTFYRMGKAEDMDMLFNLDYFSRLVSLGTRWKQRTFISAGITAQVNTMLNTPLFLTSAFGLPELPVDTTVAGNVRTTLRGESVFFSPLRIANFKFAPFVFSDLCLFTPGTESVSKSNLYEAVGGGIRARNESLIFGTIELRGFYFPRKDYFIRNSWRIEVTTNLRFKYNTQFINRPELIVVN